MRNSLCLITLVVFAALLSTEVVSAGNYLDNYFCTNEICNQHWEQCPSPDPDPEDIDEKCKLSIYCCARRKFFLCVKQIPSNQSSQQLNTAYSACRKPITYANSGTFFYFLNCQINCGYQSLWVSCGQQLNQITDCPGDDCISTNAFNEWNSIYSDCYNKYQNEMCSSIYFLDTDSINLVDCQNAVKAKCKINASNQVGSKNAFVQLLECAAQAKILQALAIITILLTILFQ